MEHILDCKGLKCPLPVITTKKFFDQLQEGSATVIVDNEVANSNISKFAQSSGFDYSSEQKEGLYYIKISKSPCACKPMNFSEEKLVIMIGNDKLGLGDDELGTLLMKSYIFALSESDKLPSDILFLNGGVKLAVEGSDCLGSIKSLSEKGVNIFCCGTCLDFFGLKEKLGAGEITNMYTIVEKMNTAANTVKL
ncbi:MAG: SirA family protein [Firmicutes bacterium]|nr:SirA family protein [Bacillota bacterium]